MIPCRVKRDPGFGAVGDSWGFKNKIQPEQKRNPHLFTTMTEQRTQDVVERYLLFARVPGADRGQSRRLAAPS